MEGLQAIGGVAFFIAVLISLHGAIIVVFTWIGTVIARPAFSKGAFKMLLGFYIPVYSLLVALVMAGEAPIIAYGVFAAFYWIVAAMIKNRQYKARVKRNPYYGLPGYESKTGK